MRAIVLFAFLSLAAVSLEDSWRSDGGPWLIAPRIALDAHLGTYPNGEPATVFTVREVSPDDVPWHELSVSCPDGTGPEPWGGALSAWGEVVRPGDELLCDGTGLTIVHLPTDTLVHDSAL